MRKVGSPSPITTASDCDEDGYCWQNGFYYHPMHGWKLDFFSFFCFFFFEQALEKCFCCWFCCRDSEKKKKMNLFFEISLLKNCKLMRLWTHNFWSRQKIVISIVTIRSKTCWTENDALKIVRTQQQSVHGNCA